MRTPANTECPYYYEDFYRGRSAQECTEQAAAHIVVSVDDPISTAPYSARNAD